GRFQKMIKFLFGAKCLGSCFIAHLDKISERQIGQRVGVYFSTLEIFRERTMSILRKTLQAFVKHDAIFKRRIHSLAIERDDRMRGVADKTNLVSIKPWRATDGDE